MVSNIISARLRGKGSHRTLAAFALCALGLTVVGVWTNTLGYAFGFLPENVDAASNLLFRIAFFCGIAASGAACATCAPWLQRIFSQSTILAVATLCACGAASASAFAFRQDFVNPTALGGVGFFVAGIYYGLITLQFYVFMAGESKRGLAIAAITLSLAAETLLAPLVGELAGPKSQTAIAIAAPVAIAAICALLYKASREEPQGRADGEPAGELAFYVQIALVSLALIIIRALTQPGVWGNARFGGPAEIYTLGECLASTVVLALIASVLLIPKTTDASVRYIPAFAVLILGLFVTTAKFTLSAETSPLIQITAIAIECFAHLFFWVLVIDSMSSIRKPWRAAGLALACYALFAIVWVLFFENVEDIITTLLFALGYVIAMVALLVMYRRGESSPAMRPDAIPAAEDAPNPSPFDALLERADLTPREVEIVDLLLEGKTRADIASTLFIAENTVKTHVSHIYEKLGISSRNELFALKTTAAKQQGALGHPGEENGITPGQSHHPKG